MDRVQELTQLGMPELRKIAQELGVEATEKAPLVQAIARAEARLPPLDAFDEDAPTDPSLIASRPMIDDDEDTEDPVATHDTQGVAMGLTPVPTAGRAGLPAFGQGPDPSAAPELPPPAPIETGGSMVLPLVVGLLVVGVVIAAFVMGSGS